MFTGLLHFANLRYLTALKAAVDSVTLTAAAEQLSLLTSVPEDKDLVLRVAQKARNRVDQKNAAFDALVGHFLAFKSA